MINNDFICRCISLATIDVELTYPAFSTIEVGVGTKKMKGLSYNKQKEPVFISVWYGQGICMIKADGKLIGNYALDGWDNE